MWLHLASRCEEVSPLLKADAQREVDLRLAKTKANKENTSPITPSQPSTSTITPQSTNSNLSPLIFQDSPLSNRATRIDSRPLQRQKTANLEDSPIGSSFYGETLPKPSMSREQQSEFAADVCRLLVICNIAWWAVDQPYWRAFFEKWQPAAYMPGRKELSGRILNDEAEKVKGKMKGKVKGHYGSGQNDGWKNIAKTSLIASMVMICYVVSQI